jgi:AcrR family transcriptional regulator
MKEKDRRCRKTEKAIREAFLSLLAEEDYGKIKVTDIVRKADIGRKTFYLHYDGKEDIVNEIREEISLRTQETIRKYLSGTTPYDIHSIFVGMDELIENNLPFLKMVAKRDSFHFFQSIFKDVLKEAIVLVLAERYRITDVSVDYYCEFYSSGIIALFMKWLREEKDALSIEEITAIADKVCFKGVDYLMSENHIQP